MEIHNSSNKKIIFLLLFCLVILTFSPYLFTGYTTADDTTGYIHYAQEGSMVKKALEDMKENPRLNHLPNILLFFPVFSSSLVYFRVVAVLLHVLTLLFFAFLLYRISRSLPFACLTVLLYMAFLPDDPNHSLATSYPAHYFIFCMFLVSVYLFFLYLERKNYSCLAGSVALYFLVLLWYEMYVPFVLVFLLLAGYTLKQEPSLRLFKNAFFSARYHFFAMILFFMVYVLFYLFFPRLYTGIIVSQSLSLLSWAKVVFVYSFSSFPLLFGLFQNSVMGIFHSSFFSSLSSLSSLLSDHPEFLVKAVIVGFLVFALLWHIGPRFVMWDWIFWGCLSLVLLFLPQVLVAMTQMHQLLVEQGEVTYHTTSFSFFGMVMLLAVCMAFARHSFKKSPRLFFCFLLLCSFFVAVGSLLTDFQNYHVQEEQQQSFLRWQAFRYFLQSKEFLALEDGSVVSAPSLWKHHSGFSLREDYWSNYALAVSRKNVTFLPSASGNGTPYLLYLEDPVDHEQIMLFAAHATLQQGHFFTDEVHVYLYSKEVSYLFLLHADALLSGNGSCHGLCNVSVTLQPRSAIDYLWKDQWHWVGQSDVFHHVVLEGRNIDMDSILPSEGTSAYS